MAAATTAMIAAPAARTVRAILRIRVIDRFDAGRSGPPRALPWVRSRRVLSPPRSNVVQPRSWDQTPLHFGRKTRYIPRP
jgi:hypothetical protein